MHSDPPGPYTATRAAHLIGGPLIGGPLDGETWNVRADTSEIQTETDRWRYCPHASARQQRDCFIHHFIDHDFFAR